MVSVAHLDAVRADRIPAHDGARLVPVDELPPLKYDHDEIVRSAVAALRSDYRQRPDPAGLLPDGPFTVRDLRLLHEQVLGERLVADTFRRTMLPNLQAVGESRRGARGKPAELYQRAERHTLTYADGRSRAGADAPVASQARAAPRARSRAAVRLRRRSAPLGPRRRRRVAIGGLLRVREDVVHRQNLEQEPDGG